MIIKLVAVYLGQALAQNPETLFITRFISGTFASAPLTVRPHNRETFHSNKEINQLFNLEWRRDDVRPLVQPNRPRASAHALLDNGLPRAHYRPACRLLHRR